MTEPRRGEVWWGEIEDVGRRPFLVDEEDRPDPGPAQRARGAGDAHDPRHPDPTPSGASDGMPTECVASFDNLRVVAKAYRVERQCTLDPVRLTEACEALQAAVDC